MSDWGEDMVEMYDALRDIRSELRAPEYDGRLPVAFAEGVTEILDRVMGEDDEVSEEDS